MSPRPPSRGGPRRPRIVPSPCAAAVEPGGGAGRAARTAGPARRSPARPAQRARRRPGRGTAGRARAARRWGAGPCAGSCWPRTRTPRRSWTRLRSWRRACGSRSRRCRGPGSTRRPAPSRPRASWPWPAPSSRWLSRTWPRPTATAPRPFLLVAAGITDPRNLGALLRSAECAGVTGVVLPRHRSARLSPTVTKTAAGAIEHLPFAVVGGVPAALSELRDLGVWSIGLAGEADQSLYDLPLGDGPDGAGRRQRGEGAGAVGAPALRCGGRHSPARHAALAQRRRGRSGRLLRGGPPARRRSRR